MNHRPQLGRCHFCDRPSLPGLWTVVSRAPAAREEETHLLPLCQPCRLTLETARDGHDDRASGRRWYLAYTRLSVQPTD